MDLSSNQEPTTQATKVCTRCGKELPVDQFSRRSSSADGLQMWCKSCQRESQRISRSNRQLPPPQSRATRHPRLRNLHRVSLSKNCITVAIAASFNTSTL